MEATVAKLREVLVWGVQRVRAQMDPGNAGQSSAAVAARAGAGEEAGRGSEEHTARPDAEDETG